MEDLINVIDETETTNFTLIIPSVAVGNVAQLTVDLLISTYKFKKYATIWHPAIIPIVGADPYFEGSDELSTACELYVHKELELVAMQIRSGFERKLASDFFRKLKRSLVFKHVVILSSAFAYELHDVSSSPYRYISDGPVPKLEALNVSMMDKGADGKYTIFGGGFATRLYEMLNEKCTVIFKYTSEGDNRPDAVEMLNVLCSFLDNFEGKISKIVYPISWQYTFGNPPPLGIY